MSSKTKKAIRAAAHRARVDSKTLDLNIQVAAVQDILGNDHPLVIQLIDASHAADQAGTDLRTADAAVHALYTDKPTAAAVRATLGDLYQKLDLCRQAPADVRGMLMAKARDLINTRTRSILGLWDVAMTKAKDARAERAKELEIAAAEVTRLLELARPDIAKAEREAFAARCREDVKGQGQRKAEAARNQRKAASVMESLSQADGSKRWVSNVNHEWAAEVQARHEKASELFETLFDKELQ